MNKKFYAIEQVRGGKMLSEIAVGKDHVYGYQGYMIDPDQKLFTKKALEEGLISVQDIKRIRKKVEGVGSFGAILKTLKEMGATTCIYCGRSTDKCRTYASCVKNNRLK